MSDTIRVEPARSAAMRREDWWYLAAGLLGALFGHLCVRWTPELAFQAAAALGLVLVCALRPHTGLLIVLGLTLALEENAVAAKTGAAHALSFPGRMGAAFFGNLNGPTRIPWLYVSFMEVLLLIVLAGWLARRLPSGRLRWQGGILGPPLLALVLVLVVGIARGLAAGAELRIALWETRGLFHFAAACLLAAHVIERPAQVRALVWTVIAALLFRVAVAWTNAALLKFRLGLVDTVTTHEDGIYFAFLVLLWACLHLFRAERGQRLTLGLLMVAIAAALIFSKRRAAMVAFVVMVPYLLALINWRRARRVMGYGLGMVLLTFPYAALFWNSASPAALPIQLLRSVTSTDTMERNGSSNHFRVVENRVLMSLIGEKPLLGWGFGREYRVRGAGVYEAEQAAAELPELDYELSKYVPHNQILWVWVKAGAVGFVVFWVLMILTVALGTRLARSLGTPFFRAFAIATTLLLGMILVAAFVDVMLTAYRNMVFAGIMVGAMLRLRDIERAEHTGKTTRSA